MFAGCETPGSCVGSSSSTPPETVEVHGTLGKRAPTASTVGSGKGSTASLLTDKAGAAEGQASAGSEDAQGSRADALQVGMGRGDYKLVTEYHYVGDFMGDYDGHSCHNLLNLDLTLTVLQRHKVYLVAGLVGIAVILSLILVLSRPRSNGSFMDRHRSASLGAPPGFSPYQCVSEAMMGDELRAWCCQHRYSTCGGPPASLLRPALGGARATSAERAHSCPGAIDVEGYGRVSLVNAALNVPHQHAGTVEEKNGAVIPHMKGRTYFAEGCVEDSYDRGQYASFYLLGKTLEYTVDLSGAGCGCNAALYLTSLSENDDPTQCSDFYCDANKVCGINCAEIDIMEANERAFYATLHSYDDGTGVGGGYGAARSDWNTTLYGRDGRCIDTRFPFAVAAHFPTNASGDLVAMEVTLSQTGKSCPLTSRIDEYRPFGRDGIAELSRALKRGMTPIVSYWGTRSDMRWMDGLGREGNGPCAVDLPERCSDSVRLFGFSVY